MYIIKEDSFQQLVLDTRDLTIDKIEDEAGHNLDYQLAKKHMILELKQTGKLTDKEFNQICRYMEERRQHYTWGNKTTGMLINFGDNELECWALYYAIPEGSIRNPSHLQTPRLTRVLLYKEERPPISTFVDSFTYLINKS